MEKVVQMVGACWVNKGDRLMVRSVQKRFQDKYVLPLPVWLNTPASDFFGPRNMSQMFAQAAYRAAQYVRHGVPSVLLDCSGYQYGDPWAAMGKVLSMRLVMYQRFRARGGRIILLPQSLGPYTERVTASTAAGVFQLADLIFARDEVSLQHALAVGAPPDRTTIAPDYSILAEAQMPEKPGEWAGRVCFVPSARMVDKTARAVSSAYVDALFRCMAWARGRGFEPFVLIHDFEDRALARTLRGSMEGGLLVIDPPPAVAKGIIASCKAVVGSRYHALVSALSQGIPAVGTGWTHKYRALFRDYGCEENLVERFESGSELEDTLDRVTGSRREGVVDGLRTCADRHRRRVDAMFMELERILDESLSLG
jgi:colanic acid/amylovoran biosynthesis protein